MTRAVLVSLFALAACATGGGPVNGAWLASEASGDVRFGQPYPTLLIEGGRISGTGGCNRYAGEITLSGDAIDIRNVASTEMACSPAIMEQERLFHTLLEDATLFDASAPGRLVLRAPDGRSLSLRSAAPQ